MPKTLRYLSYLLLFLLVSDTSFSQESKVIYKDSKEGITLTAVLTAANPKQVSILLESKPSHNTRIEKIKLKGPSGKKYAPSELLRGIQVRRLGKTEAEDKGKQKLITEVLKETQVKEKPTTPAPTTGSYPVCPTCGQSHPPGPCPTGAAVTQPEEKIKSPEEQAAIATALGLLARAKDTTREEIVLATFDVDETKSSGYTCEAGISKDGKIVAFNFKFDAGVVSMAKEATTKAVCDCRGDGCKCQAPLACGGAIHVDVMDPEYGMISKWICGGPPLQPCQCQGEGCRCTKPLICGGAIHVDIMDPLYGMISKWICGRIDRGGIGIPGGEEEEPVSCDCGGVDCECEKKGDCEGIKRCKTDGCHGQDCDCEDYCEEMPCQGSRECARTGCRGENCQCGRYCKRRPCDGSIACACGGRDCRVSNRPAWRPLRRGERPPVGCRMVCKRFPTAPCGGAKRCNTEKCGTNYDRVICSCQPYCIRRPCEGAQVCNCGNLNVECNHCQRAVCKSSNEQELKCRAGCPIERGINESVCCREPQSRSLGSCPGVYGGAWWGEHHINIFSLSAEWCGALSQNTLPADSSFSDYFRIGSYCGGNSRCVGKKEHNINMLVPTPTNQAACLENIAGAGEWVGGEAQCGQCGDTDKCVHDYDQTNNFLGYLAGSGGCWPSVGAGFTVVPLRGDKECTVYWSDPCPCRRPCGAGTSVTRGSGEGSVTFATLPCGSWICNFKVTGHPCIGTQEGSPCFCY